MTYNPYINELYNPLHTANNQEPGRGRCMDSCPFSNVPSPETQVVGSTEISRTVYNTATQIIKLYTARNFGSTTFCFSSNRLHPLVCTVWNVCRKLIKVWWGSNQPQTPPVQNAGGIPVQRGGWGPCGGHKWHRRHHRPDHRRSQYQPVSGTYWIPIEMVRWIIFSGDMEEQ